MAHLKSLSFTALPAVEANPVLDRRNRTIARLQEQKQLLAEPGYVRTVKVWAEKDGSRQQIEKTQRVLSVVADCAEWLSGLLHQDRSEGSRI